MGAAGRDFHNFNVLFRDHPDYQVVAFTAAQIPGIDHRRYPPELAGAAYPQGIPIHPEAELAELIQKHRVDLVVFSYSDISYIELMHKAALVASQGAHFLLPSPTRTMLAAQKPVISVCSVRSGCGKSQTTRKVCAILKGLGKKPVAVRHPMPYGDLSRQVAQRFSTYADFDLHRCTIEEREEYEPLVDKGIVVYAGVDYAQILAQAEAEADILVWDGGNNDTPFFRPDLHIVVFDAHRPGHELSYYPGETNLRLADIAVINKVDNAPEANVEKIRENILRLNPRAEVVLAASPVLLCHAERVRQKRVLVVEDGPTLTHGEMAYGAGAIAAQKYGAAQLVDPRPYAVGFIKEVFAAYPKVGPVLPAIGYNEAQRRDLEATINAVECDLVLFATPIHPARLFKLNKPALRVHYDYRDHGEPRLEEVLLKKMAGW